MGAMTPNGQVWYPGLTDSGEPNVMLGTLASSIENGIVPRIVALESFIGANLSLPSSQLIGYTTPTVQPFDVISSNNFNEGMTINSGIVTIPVSGMYQVNFNATFLPDNTTGARINSYIYKNGNSLAFSSAYGETVTSRYSNVNVVGVWKFAAGDTCDVRCSIADSNSNLQGGGGSCFSIALVSRS